MVVKVVETTWSPQQEVAEPVAGRLGDKVFEVSSDRDNNSALRGAIDVCGVHIDKRLRNRVQAGARDCKAEARADHHGCPC